VRRRYSNGDANKCCKGKVRHETFEEAQRAMRITGQYHGDLSLVVYKCQHCDGYHVGHPSERAMRRQLRYDRLLRLIDYANSH
jgi:hypothetical protein